MTNEPNRPTSLIPLSAERLLFVGAGQMATALAKGFSRRLLSADQIRATDPSEEARKRFEECVPGSITAADAAGGAETATLVILAVKPQVMTAVLRSIRDVLPTDALVVSVAAGISLQTLAQELRAGTRLIRVMPNTPCLIGCGASGMTVGDVASADDAERVRRLLSSVSVVEPCSESLLNVVTGLSGSGPAYVFQLIEALSDGAVLSGLPRSAASRLAAQTVLGAARMVLETGTHPAILREAVSSPGGTTIAGLHALEEGGFRAAVMNAVAQASKRSEELAGS